MNMGIVKRFLAFGLFLGAANCQNGGSWNVTSCPQICQCSMVEYSETLPDHRTIWAKTVNCAGKKLMTLDMKIPDDTEVLKVNDNLFSNLDGDIRNVSNLQNLTEIVLSGNDISILTGNITWKYIQRLTINDNRVENLTGNLFRNFPNLKEISLERNGLKSINFSANVPSNLRLLRLDSNQITDLTWLQNATTLSALNMLVLGGNQLQSSTLNLKIFQDLVDLRVLILDDMGIKMIEYDVMTSLNSLESLDLDNNLLTSIPRTVFQRLANLKFVNLNQNQFKQLTTNSFSNLSKVETIELTKIQQLTLIDEKAFSNLPNLQTVLLFKNSRLSFIAKRAFYNCPKLHTIDLHATMIESIYPQTFNIFPALKSVELSGNPVNCNCLVDGIKPWIRRTEAEESNNDVTCASPPELRGGRVKDVIIDDVTSCQPTVQPTFPYRIGVNFNDDIELPCRAYGIPEPKIVWFLPNGDAVSNATEKNVFGETTLQEQRNIMVDAYGTLYLKVHRSGDYVCTAENNNGMASRKININILQTTATSTISTIANTHPQTTSTVSVKPTTKTVLTTADPQTTTITTLQTENHKTTTAIPTTTTEKSTSKKTTTTTTVLPTTQQQSTAARVLTTTQQVSCLQVPSIEVLDSNPTSALITWNSPVTPLTWKSLAKKYVMLISLEHNGRIISTEEVQAFSFTSNGDINLPEYKISLLNPSQLYKICLIVSCKALTYTNRSCVEINTTPNFENTSSTVAVNTSIVISDPQTMTSTTLQTENHKTTTAIPTTTTEKSTSKKTTTTTVLPTPQQQSTTARVLTTTQQVSCLQVPSIEVLDSNPTSALITWNLPVTPLTWKSLAKKYVMLISLEHNGRIISTEEVQAFSFTSNGDINSPEYKISLLNPSQLYKICLIVSCKALTYTNRSCVEINTTPNFENTSSTVAVNTSIVICVIILVIGLLLVLCYGKICHPYTWRSPKYEGLEESDKPNYKHAIPLNNMYSPLLPVNQSWAEEPTLTDKLVDTTSSAVYGV